MTHAVPETRLETTRGAYAQIGIRQLGDPVLRRTAKPLLLPSESPLAIEIIDCLFDAIRLARGLHDFSPGIGLSAPQIGISRRAVIVHPIGQLPIRMLNPRVASLSVETDVRFEGCLSFFDYRGEVRRPLSATIEFADVSGVMHEIDLDGDPARLALHEIDHLDGRLYVDRMAPGDRLIQSDHEYP